MILRKTNTWAFLAALLLHCVIALAFLGFSQQKHAGDELSEVVSVYVYASESRARAAEQSVTGSAAQSVTTVNQKSHLESDSFLGNDQLLMLLHNMIKEALIYPAQAIQLGYEGVTSMSLCVHPDGHISDILLLESAGFLMLDHAAEVALNQVALQSGSVQNKACFDVPISFSLS